MKKPLVARRLVPLICAFAVCFVWGPAFASELVGFQVSPRLSANQRDFEKTYFDLQVRPGESQRLELDIYNTGTEDMYARVEAVNPFANDQGVIEYKAGTLSQSTGQPSFTSLATVQDEQVRIPAGEVVTVGVSLTMPQEAFSGELFGAVLVTKLLPSEIAALDPSQVVQPEGVAIQNQFSYAIGVILTESDEVIPPAFSLESVRAAQVDYQDAFIFALRNEAPLLAQAMALELAVYQDDKQVTEAANPLVKMVPSSVMEYVMLWPEGKLPAGAYTGKARVTYQGQSWDLFQDFIVSE